MENHKISSHQPHLVPLSTSKVGIKTSLGNHRSHCTGTPGRGRVATQASIYRYNSTTKDISLAEVFSKFKTWPFCVDLIIVFHFVTISLPFYINFYLTSLFRKRWIGSIWWFWVSSCSCLVLLMLQTRHYSGIWLVRISMEIQVIMVVSKFNSTSLHLYIC